MYSGSDCTSLTRINPPLQRRLAHDPPGDGDAHLVADQLPEVAGDGEDHQGIRIVRRQQPDVDVGVAEQLVDGVPRPAQQILQHQVRGDNSPDAGDQGQALDAALLALVPPRVLDRHGGVPGEQGERLHVPHAEPARGLGADPEESDHAVVPEDGHSHDGVVGQVRLRRPLHVPVAVVHNRALGLEHHPGQTDPGAISAPISSGGMRYVASVRTTLRNSSTSPIVP